MTVLKKNLMFPKLNPAEIALLSRFGSERSTAGNEILFDHGDTNVPLFVILEGGLEIVRAFKKGEPVILSHGPGEFSGDVNLLLGNPSPVRGKTREPSRLLEIRRDDLLRIAEADSSLGEVFLRSYLLRWAYSDSSMAGESLLVGSNRSPGTVRVRAFMERSAYRYTYIDLDRESAVRWLFDQFAVRPDEVPILICGGRIVLRNPSNAMVANSLDVLSSADFSSMWNIEMAVFSPSGK